MVGVKEKFVILLVKKMLGWDRGADDDLKMEEGVRRSYWMKWRLGWTIGPDLDLEEGGQLCTFWPCARKGRRRFDLLHQSFGLINRDLESFPLIFIISDWCLSALIAICDWYCQLVRRQEDHLIVYRLLTLVQWKYTWYYQVSTNYLLGDRVLGTTKSQKTLQIKYKIQ